jgi:site-specific recombinase XerD
MSVNLILKKNKENAKGLIPIYLRIIINRQPRFISTGHYIPPKFWNDSEERVKDEYAFAGEINVDITQKKKEALQNIVNAGVKKEKITSSSIKELTVLAEKKNDFFVFADHYTNLMRSKRSEGTLESWRKHLLKLEKFIGARQINFEDITPDYLTRFESYLLGKGVNHRKEGSNYAFAIMKTIKVFFNAAIKRKVTAYYPFSEYEMPEQTAGDKDHLTLKELDAWTKFYKTTKQPDLKEAALYYLFGCYSGLRISDWFLFDLKKRVHADHIALRAKKNNQWITIPIHSRLKFVLSEMKRIPLSLPEPMLNARFKTIAGKCKIDKHISSHCGRKTFAVTMCLERGISSETAAELMGITLETFVKAYSKVTAQKIKAETEKAWKGL